jgi:hypothetical protein
MLMLPPPPLPTLQPPKNYSMIRPLRIKLDKLLLTRSTQIRLLQHKLVRQPWQTQKLLLKKHLKTWQLLKR